MKEQQPSLKRILQPYLFIAFAGLLAFAPVSFMLKALKNDIIALEYPINHFMSQCIRNGELPYWFNTWGMGFPLDSDLTWGIFSTPQMLFSSLFNYNIYVLHIEFMFFVLLAGWGMFYLLNKHFIKDKTICQLLAISYMLSGFMVGSTQWLLYITAAAFVPIVISSLLSLLKKPSAGNAFQFAILYTMMFTSVYAAFNIITSYSIALFLLLWFLLPGQDKKTKGNVFRFTLLAGALTGLLCFPSLYYTAELLQHIERGNAIVNDTAFFNSNYLHPSALSSMVLPFSSVKMNYPNTEGTMLNTYAGLFVLILLPAAVWQSVKERNRSALLLLGVALFFLLASFGDITPLRNALNILPGFSYFRNPAIFRFFFLVSIFLFLGLYFRQEPFNGLADLKKIVASPIIKYTMAALLALCAFAIFSNLSSIRSLTSSSLSAIYKNINWGQAIIISAFVQLAIIFGIVLTTKAKRFALLKILLTADLVINTLLCTPFFSVSSYSIPEVTTILQSTSGFPLQQKNISAVNATYIDSKQNKWNNVNIFSKEVSSNDSYRGPLTLSNFYLDANDSLQREKMLTNPLVFADNDSATEQIQLLLQKPTHIRAAVNFNGPALVTVLQNYYPGWTAWYNDKKMDIVTNNKPGITINVPTGKGVIDFRYERPMVWIAALVLHLITIIFLVRKCSIFWRRRRSSKWPSLS